MTSKHLDLGYNIVQFQHGRQRTAGNPDIWVIRLAHLKQ